MTQWQADWYPDPLGRYELRYWDGAQWTDHVATQGVQALDPLAQAQAQAAQAAQAAGARASGQPSEQASGRPAWTGHGDLLTEPVLIVGRPTATGDRGEECAVRDAHGRRLGSVRAVRPTAGKGALAKLGLSEQRQALEIHDPHGEVLIQVLRPRFRSGRVVVQDAEGRELGQVVRQSVWGRSRLSLESAGHQHGAVDAEDWGERELTVQDDSGAIVARISADLSDVPARTSADRYVVEIDRPLEEPLRSLVVGVALAVDTVLKQDIEAFASM